MMPPQQMQCTAANGGLGAANIRPLLSPVVLVASFACNARSSSSSYLQAIEPDKWRPSRLLLLLVLVIQLHVKAADVVASHMQLLQVGQTALQDSNLQV